MKIKDLVRAVTTVSKKISDEVADAGKIANESLEELDRLLVKVYEVGLIDDNVFGLAMKDKRYWDEKLTLPGWPSITMLIDDLLQKNWDRLMLGCSIRELADLTGINEFKDAERYSFAVKSIFAQKLAKLLSDTEPQIVCRQLNARGGAIFRYLLNNPRGVTFNEFQDAEDPDTGQRLTRSEDRDSIKAMLNRLSGKLAEHGYQIKVSQSKNLIMLERYV
ncbi:MAG: hypothetical protein JNL67_01590 [Planctomycetaceae bacterium]|nr:hypothetical protein [Planctomycetaceae bacterium]